MRVVLALLPVWNGLTPPMGLACLKAAVQAKKNPDSTREAEASKRRSCVCGAEAIREYAPRQSGCQGP